MPEVPGVFPLDEYPIHQIAAPIEYVGTDRNFYDRSYWNAHDRSGEIFLITGIGYYPNLGTKDAFLLVRRGEEQTALHFGDKLDSDRLNQHVGNYRIEVIEPLQDLAPGHRGDRGDLLDMTWRGLFPAIPEQRHIMRAGGHRAILDAQRFAQVGSWEGTIVDRRPGRYDVTPDTLGRHPGPLLGLRPIGEAEPAGQARGPAVRRHVVALRADRLRGLRDDRDHPGGAGRHPDPQRLPPRLARRPHRAARLAAA